MQADCHAAIPAGAGCDAARQTRTRRMREAHAPQCAAIESLSFEGKGGAPRRSLQHFEHRSICFFAPS